MFQDEQELKIEMLAWLDPAPPSPPPHHSAETRHSTSPTPHAASLVDVSHVDGKWQVVSVLLIDLRETEKEIHLDLQSECLEIRSA